VPGDPTRRRGDCQLAAEREGRLGRTESVEKEPDDPGRKEELNWWALGQKTKSGNEIRIKERKQIVRRSSLGGNYGGIGR